MNPESLENLLREKIVTEKPRPGFETRIQAMAREPRIMAKRRSDRWMAGLALAAVVLVVSLPKQPKSPLPATVDATPPQMEIKVAATKIKEETPVHKEIEGMKSDARRAFDFLSDTIPSLIQK